MTPTDATARGAVLVTGAAGGLGSRLVRALLDRGYAVRGLVLPGDPARRALEHAGCEVREADVSRAESLQGVCAGVQTIYHLAAVILSHDARVFGRVNRDGTEHLLQEAAAASVRHFIYASSASVTYPERTAYAESKLEAEGLVQRERRLAHTIVRPTLVFDATGGEEFRMFGDYLERFAVVPFIGAGHARKRPVFSDDLVDGLLRIVDNPAAYGKSYNLSGDEAISMLELARLVLRHRAQSRPFVHLPVWLCRLTARCLALLMVRPPLTASAIAGVTQDADLDPSEARRDLGYHPLGVREGLQRCFPLEQRAQVVRSTPFDSRSEEAHESRSIA